MKYNFPRQSIPYRKKTKEWVKECIKFADSHSVLSSSTVRKTIAHKKLNYDLLNGKLNMSDLNKVINANGFKFSKKYNHNQPINHYPIVNKIIELLVGEESATELDYKAVITNPTAITEKEKVKKAEIINALQRIVEEDSSSDEELQQKLQELSKYYNYEYQDIRELRANQLLNHYSKEQNFKNIFIDGFIDCLTVNEAIFQISLEHGEPVLRRLNPTKVHVYGNGHSNRIEDADMVVIEDYWQIGRILDTYYDQLSTKDIKFLEDMQGAATGREENKYGEYGDPLINFMFGEYSDDLSTDIDGNICFSDNTNFSQLPYDINGNVRVLQVYWKSFRKIKEIKYYDQETGKTEYKFVTEDYIPNEDLGEEAKVYYINEAWHGVMIGAGEDALYVDLGPCKVQYNRLSNPSKCHFGIIGQIFNYNESQPYSIIDKVKPYAYLYDAVADKLVKTIQNNLGKLVQFNMSMMPDKWEWEQWVHVAKTTGIAMVDPMKEGNRGAAKNKLAGAFQVPPAIDADLSQSISSYVNILQFIEQELTNMIGITQQRLGAIQNRETVGGIERSTLQSSHITRWYFEKYNDLKKRVLECVLDTAKIGCKGRNVKFQHILSDLTMQIVEFDGDEFAEADYGLVVSADYDIEKFRQEIDQVSQYALQGQMINLSTFLKLKSSGSLSEKIKMVEQNEEEMLQRMQQQQQQALQAQQEQAQAEMEFRQAELQQKDVLNQRDNETKLLIASISASTSKDADGDGLINEGENNVNDEKKLEESIRQFNERLAFDKEKHKDDVALKRAALNKKPSKQ